MGNANWDLAPFVCCCLQVQLTILETWTESKNIEQLSLCMTQKAAWQHLLLNHFNWLFKTRGSRVRNHYVSICTVWCSQGKKNINTILICVNDFSSYFYKDKVGVLLNLYVLESIGPIVLVYKKTRQIRYKDSVNQSKYNQSCIIYPTKYLIYNKEVLSIKYLGKYAEFLLICSDI